MITVYMNLTRTKYKSIYKYNKFRNKRFLILLVNLPGGS